jgi:hypothetical protein
MEIYSLIPCAAGRVAWDHQPGDVRVTIVAKRTFALDRSFELASSQEPLYEDDRISSAGSTYRPSDLAPFKKNVDCVIVGSAYTGTGEAFSDLEVALRLGGRIHKRIRVTATPPARKVSLSYEHAAGGAGTANPLGSADGVGPQGQRVRITPLGPASADEPLGMAPIPASWPSRVALNPTRWVGASPYELGAVGHVSPLYFQCSPSDQQTPTIATGDYLELFHLLPNQARLVLALPALAPILMVFEEGQDLSLLTMRCDLLVVDTDRQVMTATSRVTLAKSAAAITAVVASAQHASMELGEIAAALNNPDGARRLRAWFTSRMTKRAVPLAKALTEEPVPRVVQMTARLAEAPRPEQPAWLAGAAVMRSSASLESVPPAAWSSAPVPPVRVEQSSTMVIDLPGAEANAAPLGRPNAPPPAPPPPFASSPAPGGLAPVPAAVARAAEAPVPELPPERVVAPPRANGVPLPTTSAPRGEAHLPSYLKQMAEAQRPAQPPAFLPDAHDAGAAHARGAAGASDAAVAAVPTPIVAEEPLESLTVVSLLFVDEQRLADEGVRAELLEISPEPPRPVDDEESKDALDWVPSSASDEDEVPLDALITRVLLAGRPTPLSQIGFRLVGAEKRLLRAPLTLVEGHFSATLSRVQSLRAQLRIAALALAPTDAERAVRLRTLLELLSDDLEAAPVEVFATVEEELQRSCDGEERRPTLSDVTRAAERTVRQQRGFARIDGADGGFVLGALSAGPTQVRIHVPESFVASLPADPRWPAVILGRPTMAEGRVVALRAVAVGRRLDPTSIVIQAS